MDLQDLLLYIHLFEFGVQVDGLQDGGPVSEDGLVPDDLVLGRIVHLVQLGNVPYGLLTLDGGHDCGEGTACNSVIV